MVIESEQLSCHKYLKGLLQVVVSPLTNRFIIMTWYSVWIGLISVAAKIDIC
jgi:hypothetical protein